MKQKFLLLALFLIMGSWAVKAQNQINVKFNRTGTNASSVSFKVVDENGKTIPGATVKMTASHAFKGTGNKVNNAIVCPNVNGNSKPKINMTFSMAGLPEGFKFNTVNLDIHALNGGGGYQSSDDGHARQYNVIANTGKDAGSLSQFGALEYIDIAAGVNTNGDTHKFWAISKKEGMTVSNTLVLSLDITAGDNGGCFFGLSEIKLNSQEIVEPEPEPEPEVDLSNKIFNIAWKKNVASYMAEEADGSIVTVDYDVAQRMFWKFVPTEKKNVYYLQNTATSRYIGSCNLEAADPVKMSKTPVAYYVGKTAATSGDIADCYYLSSTDCAGYNVEGSGPKALNKDGSTGVVVSWQAGTSRKGSYWRFLETEDLYEIRPFQSSTEVGQVRFTYVITSSKGQALTMNEDGSLAWSNKNDSEEQTWYFVGTSNRTEGYLMVNLKNHRVFAATGEKATRLHVLSNTEGDGYLFRPFATKDDAQTTLTFAGEQVLKFRALHSKLARKNQVYELPCGALGSIYLVRMNISGTGVQPMQYPMATVVGNNIITSNAEAPSSWYTLFTKSQATVVAGQKFNVSLRFNAAPLVGQEAYLYFDWNRDGIFETTQQVDLSTMTTAEVAVPADAVVGKSRMRLRLTDNGLVEGDDEVTGQIFDCMLNTVASSEAILTVLTNNDMRGTVSPTTDSGEGKTCEVTAYPKGNATFVCWREGSNIVSVDRTYSFVLDHNTTLKAYFSPNTDETSTGIGEAFSENNQIVEVSANQKQIQVSAQTPVKKVLVFNPNGALVAQSNSNVVDLAGTPVGTYIVKVYTTVADQTVKVLLK